MSRFSIATLARQAFNQHKGWTPMWRRPEPKSSYDVVIVGAGGHGLATAYYLASEHGVKNIAVIEKGWLGGGNTGRNTTIIRSNYLWKESGQIYDHAVKLWESLSSELNYNVMYSGRGVLSLAHNLHDMRELQRRVAANHALGIDSEFLTSEQVKEFCPAISISKEARYPILGASLQRRGGVARHDAVAWGYARAADQLGVDIIEQCEVTGIQHSRGRITGIETTRGKIKTSKVGLVAAGHTSVLCNMAGLRVPLESYSLQALVSEPVKPLIDTVIMSNAVHGYISQSDKGEFVIGAGTDKGISYSQRGCNALLEHTVGAIVELFPTLSRMRMLRSWGGAVDVTRDRSPILSSTSIGGLYINCGWGTGGFKATPGSGHLFAYTIAQDRPHPINAPFSLDRFASGHLIDEASASGVAH